MGGVNQGIFGEAPYIKRRGVSSSRAEDVIHWHISWPAKAVA
jgi:hypothetical protein